MRNAATVLCIFHSGVIWELLYNPNFKPTEFEEFRRQDGLTPKLSFRNARSRNSGGV